MIGIVDYNMGNLASVKNAFEVLGEKVVVGNRSIISDKKRVIGNFHCFNDFTIGRCAGDC